MTGAMNGSTSVVGTNGEVGTTTPGLSSKDRAQVAIGAAMTPLLNDVTRSASRPITVSMAAQPESGIMFGADVMSNGTLGSAYKAADAPQARPNFSQTPVAVTQYPGVAPTSGTAQSDRPTGYPTGIIVPGVTYPVPGNTN